MYKVAAERLLGFLGEAADKDIAVITKEQLLRFRADLEGKLSPRTVNTVLRRTRMIFKAARRDGYIVENPAEFLESVRDRTKEKWRPFKLEEIRRMLEMGDPEWQSLILCGLYTGQRLYDLAELTWDNTQDQAFLQERAL